jgi:hypothetical protein
MTNNNTNGTQTMTATKIRETVQHMSREQLIELVVGLAKSEQEKREQLDKFQGIIR